MGSLESDTTEQLHFHFSLTCIAEGNGNPLQCSCLESPRDGQAWWAAVYGCPVQLGLWAHLKAQLGEKVCFQAQAGFWQASSSHMRSPWDCLPASQWTSPKGVRGSAVDGSHSLSSQPTSRNDIPPLPPFFVHSLPGPASPPLSIAS